MIRDIPSENNPENIQIIIDEANRLGVLVNDLLSLSKISSRTEPLNLSVYDINNNLINIVERFNKLLESKGFVVNYLDNGPIYVNADIRKIEQVIYNLINNAVNYSGDSRKIEVESKITDQKVRISVKDYGIGIKKDELEYIWDRYYRVDKGHQRAVQGSGLGLSIIKGILEYHGFEYGVESVENVGSTFYFIMPIINKK
jgi:signal transduction histidine kinase